MKRSGMGIAVMKGLRFADTQESCFEVANIHIWVVSTRYVVDLLMFRNSVFILQNGRIWAVSNCKGSICSLSGMEFSGY